MKNIVILLHLDWDEYIKQNLPIYDIIKWAFKHNYSIFEVYHSKKITSFNSILDYKICKWNDNWFKDLNNWNSIYFRNCNIILTGGYKNQCIKWVYNNLITKNNVYINPTWIVNEPLLYWFGETWNYPKECILA